MAIINNAEIRNEVKRVFKEWNQGKNVGQTIIIGIEALDDSTEIIEERKNESI